jgi:methionyl-tRNA synthetase
MKMQVIILNNKLIGGDQCDKCNSLLEPTELINPKCTVCKNKPVLKDSKHLYLELPKLSEKITEWKKESISTGCWSNVAISITDTWLKQGLEDRCITRDLNWGTKVPLDDYKNKVFYVWFDAPIGYISITANYTKNWEKWWKGKDVELVQFMGKDNVSFHSIIFPGSLIGTKDNYNLVNKLSATDWLNYEIEYDDHVEVGKFSKRNNTGKILL